MSSLSPSRLVDETEPELERATVRFDDALHAHVMQSPYFLPLLFSLSTTPLSSPSALVYAALSEISRIVMAQASGTPLVDIQTPQAANPATEILPSVDGGAQESISQAPVEINENTDLASLTPAQLYDLNQNVLNETTSSDRPLIAAVASMGVLRAEYENGSQSFVKQIDFLQADGYHGIRRTRGDGDCFYRSLAFAYIERILMAEDPSLAVMMAISTIDAALPMLNAAGFQKIVYEDFWEVLLGLLKRIEPGLPNRLTTELLLEAFQDPEVSNYVVVFLRLLTSAQIRMDPDAFEPFLLHPELGVPMTTRDFCEAFVEAVGREADHVQVTALARVLKINVKVAYLDGRSADGKVDFVEFKSAIDEQADPLVLLYRPGHYDILDTRSIDVL